MKHTLLALLALLALATPAQSADFDLERWLNEPDVKLVAVEFYADWCGPCKESAPRWEALRKKYAADGLKLVVVNLSEAPSGGAKRCTRLPWNPDESLCDPELGEKLGVKSLPEAFVWSWQGNLLVDRGQHVDTIERIIRRYLDDNPRVQIVALGTNGQADKGLQRQVEAALARSGKLTVVPDAEMQKRLADVRKDSHGATKRDDQRCALGSEVSANSLLTAERFEGAIALSLADAESGCQRATASVPWDDARPDKAIEKVTYRLMEQLKRRDVEMPKGSTLGAPTRTQRADVDVEDVSGDDEEWVAEEEQPGSVKFTSDPAGAKVMLDGKLACDATPCKVDIEPGRHQVAMSLARHKPLNKRVTLEVGQIVGWSLKPNFGTLTVQSDPPGMTVTIGGKDMGKTPLDGLELTGGKHTVSIGDACHRPKVQKLRLPAGKSHTMNVKLKTRPAGLKIRARNPKGEPLTADVLVDGKTLGQTPKTFTLPLCAKKLEVRHPDFAPWTSTLALVEKKTIKVSAEMTTKAAAPVAKPKTPESEGDKKLEALLAQADAALGTSDDDEEAEEEPEEEPEEEAEAVATSDEESSFAIRWFGLRFLGGMSDEEDCYLGDCSLYQVHLLMGEAVFASMSWEHAYLDALRYGGGYPEYFMVGLGGGLRFDFDGSDLRLGAHFSVMGNNSNLYIGGRSGGEMTYVIDLGSAGNLEFGVRQFSVPFGIAGVLGMAW